MSSKTTKFVQVRDHALVARAQGQMETLASERQEMERARSAAWDILSPHSMRSSTEAERLRARLTLDGSDDALRLHRLKELEAAQELDAAKARAGAELAAAGRAALRPAVAALDRALAVAAEANARVRALEDELNPQPDLRVAWRELFPATPMSASRLESWQQYARAAGLLD